jgi:undecaprenyl-diphosphatase
VQLIRAGVASIIERKIGNDRERQLAWLLVIGTIPGGLIGWLAESKIEELFHTPDTPHTTGAMIAIAIVIALLGAALFIAERIARHQRGLDQVSMKDTIVIGLSQGLAVFPGVSRSGSTITAGLALGFQRETAARFSFLLATPIILLAGIRSAFNLRSELAAGGIISSDLLVYIIGFIVSALSGYLCIRFLMRFLQKNSTDVFVYYRWMLAILIVVVVFVRG